MERLRLELDVADPPQSRPKNSRDDVRQIQQRAARIGNTCRQLVFSQLNSISRGRHSQYERPNIVHSEGFQVFPSLNQTALCTSVLVHKRIRSRPFCADWGKSTKCQGLTGAISHGTVTTICVALFGTLTEKVQFWLGLNRISVVFPASYELVSMMPFLVKTAQRLSRLIATM